MKKLWFVPGYLRCYWLVWIAALVIGMLVSSSQAHAGLSITSVTVDGGSVTTVVPGATISAAVTNTGTTSWSSTGWYIGTSPPGTWQCDTGPSPSVTGTNTYTYNVIAPATPGTYNAYFRSSSSGTTCGSTTSSTYTLSSSVIVVGPPTVTSIAPNTGSTTGGTFVTITGTNFTGATAYTVGGASLTGVTVVNATTITGTTPAGTAGAKNVVVTTPYGIGTGVGLFTYGASPTVTSITPNTGSTAGGTFVTITGTNFTGATGYTVGGASLTGVTVVNATTITGTTPAGTAGAKNVVVTTPYGTGTGVGLFTYGAPPTVTSIAPNTGSTAGGTFVTITGTNFTGATGYTVGGASLTGVTVVNATTITGTTPAGTAGAKNVVVTTPYGTGTGASLFTYVAPPTVISINTASTNPTAPATAVAWTVVFSASVTGVDTTDFVLVPGGSVTGAAITTVTGSGTTWTVNANTGTGGGTLGLNLVDNDSIVNASSIPLGGAGAGNGSFTGQVYTVTPPFCSPPSNIPSGVAVSCQCDTFVRATLNPSTIFGSNWIVSTSDSTGILPSIVNSGYLRLTNNTGNNAKAATVPGIFPAAGNYISVEFRQYAYNGTGADGIAVTLSDYSVPAVPGAYGGSLGYAQETGIHDGFAGGWLGVGLDEYGNYQNTNEGRLGGLGFTVQSVGARGSGSGQTNYRWLGGTSTLSPTIDDHTSTSASLGYYYQVIVDARNEPTSTSIAVNRDTGSGYASLINIPNVYTAATAQGFTQAAVPANWQISFTGSTGGSTNIHEIGGLRICASTAWPPTGGTASGFSAIDEVYPTAANAIPAYQNFQTGHIFMKLPGAANTFKLWVAALTGTGISSGYSTVSAKYAKVNFVDNSDNACGPDSARTCTSTCTNKAAVETGAAQTVTFAVGGPGASLSPSFTLNSSWKNLVAVMKECTTSACTAFTATAPACSVDSFSVRPTGVSSVTSSDATYSGIITGPPTPKAGGNFSLTATTIGIAGYPSGYTGNLKVNNATLQLIAPATGVLGAVASSLPPASFPASISGTPSSIATGNFTYSEVGAFRLSGYDPAADTTSLRGVYDGVATASECTALGLTPAQCDALRAATWTGVDGISSKGDCILDSYRNTRDMSLTFSSNPNYGKFGCNFGLTTTTGGFGRFIPDHFTLTSAQTTQRSDIAGAYAQTSETTGTIAVGSTQLIVANATNFSVGDTVVVFGAGTGGKDLTATITAVAGNVLTLSASATTGVTILAPVFKRLGFTYMDEPLHLVLSLQASNATGGITQNYDSGLGLAKLDASKLTDTTSNSWAFSGIVNNLYGVANCRALFSNSAPYNTTYVGSGCASLPASAPAAPYAASAARVAMSNTSAVTWTSGLTTLTTDVTLKRASKTDGPFDFTNGTFALGIWPTDGDGVIFLNANDGASLLGAAKSLDVDAVASADVVAVGVADMRFGRLRIDNAYGSELLGLPVGATVQYWNGINWATSVTDSATSFATGNVAFTNCQKNLSTGGALPNNCKTAAPAPVSVGAVNRIGNGVYTIMLNAPGANNNGSADLTVDVPPWLRYNWGYTANDVSPYTQSGCSNGVAPPNNDCPVSRATFGVYKSRFIYLREMY